jgi:hypothetical protein
MSFVEYCNLALLTLQSTLLHGIFLLAHLVKFSVGLFILKRTRSEPRGHSLTESQQIKTSIIVASIIVESGPRVSS